MNMTAAIQHELALLLRDRSPGLNTVDDTNLILRYARGEYNRGVWLQRWANYIIDRQDSVSGLPKMQLDMMIQRARQLWRLDNTAIYTDYIQNNWFRITDATDQNLLWENIEDTRWQTTIDNYLTLGNNRWQSGNEPVFLLLQRMIQLIELALAQPEALADRHLDSGDTAWLHQWFEWVRFFW